MRSTKWSPRTTTSHDQFVNVSRSFRLASVSHTSRDPPWSLHPRIHPRCASSHSSTSTSNRSRVEQAHDDFHALARRQAIDYKVRHVYRDDNLLHGVSIHLANGQDASSLNALPGVKVLLRLLLLSDMLTTTTANHTRHDAPTQRSWRGQSRRRRSRHSFKGRL